MGLNTEGDLKYYTFDSFDKTGMVNHCFSTRLGGVSENEFYSLNFSYSEVSKENVDKNYSIISNAIGFDMKNSIVSGKQIHGTKVHMAHACDKGKKIPDVDGFVTDEAKVLLVTYHADCVPLFFLDPVKRVIGLSHAGWRGTVNGMAKETVGIMIDKYGCGAKDILAGIGPSIGKCCFQVEEPVVREFMEKLDFSKDFIYDDNMEDKYKIDLQAVNRQIMINCGLLRENISISGLCTMCNGGLFYSHRVMGNKRGSMAAFLELR